MRPTWLSVLALLIGLVLVPMAVGVSIDAWQQHRRTRRKRPWAPVAPAGLPTVRVAALILAFTQGFVAIPLGMIAALFFFLWLNLFPLVDEPQLVLTGILFLRSTSRARQPHLGWRWYDLTLTLVVLGGGTYLWLFGLWRARGDVDPVTGFWFCVAAVWLLAVAAAAGLILRSWRQPTRSCTTAIHSCVHRPIQ